MSDNTKNKIGDTLYTIGMILGAAVSYSLNNSIGWVILHFFLGWWYIAFKIGCKIAQYLV